MNRSPAPASPFSAMDRRQFLRGVGACIALPTFASLLPSRMLGATAAAADAGLATTASGVPLRTAFVFFPNGAIPSHFWPEGEGSAFKFNATLPPRVAPLPGPGPQGPRP